MILTGYFDESGTHGDSTVTTMAGYVADARQWRSYEKRIGKLFRRFNVDVFHAIDMRRSDDCFKGWSIDKKIKFVDEFQHIINETTEVGFTSVLFEEDYAWYKKLERPSNIIPYSKYALLGRASISWAIESVIEVYRWAEGEEPRLNIVFELGHKNAGEITQYYNRMREAFPGHRALGSLIFESKKNCIQLAASDFFAYSSYGMETGAKSLGVIKGPSKSAQSNRHASFRYRINRDTLASFHHQAIEFSGRVTPPAPRS